MIPSILRAFGLQPDDYFAGPFGSGLINHTWKVSGLDQSYILQRINHNVFKSPQSIADNLIIIGDYLRLTASEYPFAGPLPATDGNYLFMADGDYYRLFPFVKNSHTIDLVTHSQQAYEAARQFGKFSRLLTDFDPLQLNYTLPDFHNLILRVEQFQSALKTAPTERLNTASAEIEEIAGYAQIAETYARLVNDKQIPLRVIHHDTKISNVLFDDQNKGICVIDLDTVMPGYFISDVGDMMRTYLSIVNEEEQDLSKIAISYDFFMGIYEGYMEQMGDILTTTERDLFLYAGKFMIYMQALRFLTDFLNGDIYYPTQYAGHNLLRAQNQLVLLKQYINSETKFKEIINKAGSNGYR